MTDKDPTTSTPLWRDVRVLRWLFQLAVFAVVAAIVVWLLTNFQTNVSRSRIPTSFDFLNNPTSFDIPGADFNPAEPVRNAYVIGILNTIRVSVVGIILATILGVIIGLGRLSRNWIVNKLSAVYVEAIRNLPLLVILTFTFLAVVLQAMPRIENSWTPLNLIVVSNRGIGVPWYVETTGWQLLLVLLVGILGWWLLARWRRSVSERTGAPSRAGVYGGAFFVVTLVVGWSVLGGQVTLPAVDGRVIAGGIRIDPSYFALLVALVIYSASHIAEIVRGSIQAVPIGQGEAATALALSSGQRMWNVILPQAMRIAIPPIGNQYLSLIKNSSLGAGFAYFEITNVSAIAVGNGAPAVPAFTLALLLYVVLSLITSALVNVANKRFKLVER